MLPPPGGQPEQISRSVSSSTVAARAGGRYQRRDDYVTIRFTITPRGTVHDPKVIESWPDHRYDEAALRRIRGWQLTPGEVDGKAAARTAVQTIYFGPHKQTLRLINACRASADQTAADKETDLKDIVQPHCEVQKTKDYAVYRWTPTYPESACEKDIGGYATVRFRLGAKGVAIDPEVVKSKPSGVFDAAALEGIRHWHFLPFGPRAPQPGQIMTQTYKFKAPSDKSVSPLVCGERRESQREH